MRVSVCEVRIGGGSRSGSRLKSTRKGLLILVKGNQVEIRSGPLGLGEGGRGRGWECGEGNCRGLGVFLAVPGHTLVVVLESGVVVVIELEERGCGKQQRQQQPKKKKKRSRRGSCKRERERRGGEGSPRRESSVQTSRCPVMCFCHPLHRSWSSWRNSFFVASSSSG